MIIRAFRPSRSQSLIPIRSLLPPFLLPFCARLTTATHTTDPEPPPTAYRNTKPSPPSKTLHSSYDIPSPPTAQRINHLSTSPPLPSPTTPSNLSLLPLLAAQSPHYIVIHIHSRPYLLTHGDKLRLPFLMPDVSVGSTLRLTRASTIGSREYTFRGAPWIDEQHFVCRARVVGVESEPMRIIEKTKRRQRHVKTVKSKHRFTVVRCCELKVWADGADGSGDEEGSVIKKETGNEIVGRKI